MKTDIEIASQANMRPISQIASDFGLLENDIELYGRYKAKVSYDAIKRLEDKPDGKLVLVTAINPTPAGEGKTTMTVGLGQALCKLGKKAVIALREPSLGPVFGVKGGAAGGGYSQVVPMDGINLHFTGDIHAIGAANNLLCAIVDNHIYQGNKLNINPKRVTFLRAMDMNDRALRNIVVGMGRTVDGIVRQDNFQITVASEIMAILCLSRDLKDLKQRLANIVVGYNYQEQPVTAGDLQVQGALTALLRDALKPNLVQTLENTLCVMHGGPFANIAHGCNSVMATKLALKLGDYCITEAGFGADLGGEKFLDIKCRMHNLKPQVIVLVATVRALKYNGGVEKSNLAMEDLDALKAGCANLQKHIENMKKAEVPVIVSLNRFASDTQAELDMIEKFCADLGADFALCDIFAKGGAGGMDLAEKIIAATDGPQRQYKPFYDLDLPLKGKIEAVVRNVYGGGGVVYSKAAEQALAQITQNGGGGLPVCMAKTQYSLSDNPVLLGRPEGFTVEVKEVRLSAGAGFVVALLGDIMTMPGLPAVPAAQGIDVDENGMITGLF